MLFATFNANQQRYIQLNLHLYVLHELFFMQKAHAALLRVHVLFSQVFDPPFRLLRRQRRKPDINGRARFLCVSVGHAVGLPEGELDV